MKTVFSFGRTVAFALVAVGSVACFVSDTFAANRTWTNASTTAGNRNKWGSTAQFATNWSSLLNPTSADVAVFNTAPNGGSVAIQGAGVTVGGVEFTAASPSFNITGPLTLVNGGNAINNASTNAQTLADVTITNATATWLTSATNGQLNVTSANIGANELTISGNASVGSIASSSAAAKVISSSGNQVLTLANNFQGTSQVTGGKVEVRGGSVTTSNLLVTGGTADSNGNFATVTVSGGTLDQTSVQGSLTPVLNAASYSQTSGASLVMNIGYDQVTDPGNPFTVSSQIAGASFTLGGNALIKGDQVTGNPIGTSPLPIGTTWNLFTGVNFVSGSAAPPNAASNFANFVLASAGSPYAGTFTPFGQEFRGPTAADGTYMVFQAASGNLVVVPEPSTMVFAGLGVAMSGWTMWKKRRLSKVLAAKAG